MILAELKKIRMFYCDWNFYTGKNETPVLRVTELGSGRSRQQRAFLQVETM
jgi:hypothetical protein